MCREEINVCVRFIIVTEYSCMYMCRQVSGERERRERKERERERERGREGDTEREETDRERKLTFSPEAAVS